jgi:hypothetical protein
MTVGTEPDAPEAEVADRAPAPAPPAPEPDDAPVPKIPYSKGLSLSRPQMFRIGMFATLLVAIIVLAKPCSDSVSKFVTSFDDGSNPGSAMPKPGTVSVPQNLEHIGSNLTLEQYQDLVKRAEAAERSAQGSATPGSGSATPR